MMQQMWLAEVSARMLAAKCKGDKQTIITGLAIDSRRVQAGDLFFCISGMIEDGHHYAEQAVRAGATALVVERELELPVPQLIVKNVRYALAVLSDTFYKSPSHSLRLVGITGTNGKTTTAYLIKKILDDAKHKAGLIGTIQMHYGNKVLPASITTPNAYELQKLLSEMVNDGVDTVVMEVSSHALVQGRVQGCRFRTAVFTNLTQDHLDYHRTMEAYREAKGLLFSRLGNTFPHAEQDRFYAVLNGDDEQFAYFASVTTAEIITYGLSDYTDIRAEHICVTAKGTSFTVHTFKGTINIQLQIVGKFNVYNVLAAIAVGLIEGVELEAIRDSLQSISGVDGRFEVLEAGQSFAVIVDYAHTPDGLRNVLQTIKQFAENRIICVFGCGGDRDRTKRPLMAKISACYADYIIVTSDNPRTENPGHIIQDITAGLYELNVDANRYECIIDRRAAIKKAIEMASPYDVVLIAGKGHETYQIIGQEIFQFDDRLVAKEAIRGKIQ